MRILGFLLLALPAFGWNATGHRVIAAIAYDRLTPEVRAKVDALLQRHPDYATLLTRDAPADPKGRARAAFIAAAEWPDVIKGDPRFYDNLRSDAHPTPLAPGFSDMARHTNWHYFDTRYAPDGVEAPPQEPPNAMTELTRLIAEELTPYDLPWLEHIEGDVHQPLHCVSRFLKSQTEGDAGGNRVFVTPGRNLHAFWDDAVGRDTSDAYVTHLAAEITAEYPAPGHLDLTPKKWFEEGFELAKTDVYTFGLETGTADHPIALSEAYQAHAKRIAKARIALAGYRLAALLDEKLK